MSKLEVSPLVCNRNTNDVRSKVTLVKFLKRFPCFLPLSEFDICSDEIMTQQFDEI